MAYRPPWYPKADMLPMAEALHSDFNGSGDPLPEQSRDLYIRSLKWAIQNWQPSTNDEWKGYEDAVLNLIRSTLVERGIDLAEEL